MILGLAPQGLFLLREFCRAGKKVIAVGLKDNVGLYSKYGCKFTISKLTELEDILSKYLHPNINIHICSDAFLNHLIDNKNSIFRLKKCFPNFKSAVIFSDKLSTGKLAEKLGIAYPKTYRLEEIEFEKKISYPLILKWNRRKSASEPFKTILIKLPKELKEINVKQQFLKNDLILQTYIKGEPQVDISYGGYFLDGEEKLHITIQQKRQYPYPNGLSSFIEEYSGEYSEEIRKMAKVLLSETSFSGFVEVECRIDVKKDKLYLIEVNPRPFGWIKIFKRKYRGLNLDLLTGDRIESSDDICTANIARDIRAIIDMIKKQPQKIKLKNVISDYRKNPILDLFELDDLKPFIGQFRRIFFNSRNSWLKILRMRGRL